MGDEYSNDDHALAIAGSLLGEPEQATETTEEESAETTEETTTETAEEESATAAQEEVEEDVKMVPLKGQLEEKRKRQEAEARLQEYEAKLKELEERIKPKEEETDDDIYARDPQGTTSRINAEIARLSNEDPFANAERIEQLRDLKIELRENYANRQATSKNSFTAELQKAVPDINAKTKEYSDFAISDLGYDAKTVSTFSNPKIVGEKAAIDFIKSIANQYNKAQAAKTVHQKVVKPQPTKSEAPGQGNPVQTQDIGRLKEEAKSSGDWSKYLDAVGAL